VRRREQPSDGLPARLAVFRLEEWREDGDEPVPDGWAGDPTLYLELLARRRWSEARREWFRVHGGGSVVQEIIDHRRWENRALRGPGEGTADA
jgi:hypothetical protein